VPPLRWLMHGETGSELYPRHMLGLAGDTGSELVPPGERNPGVKRGMLSCCFEEGEGEHRAPGTTRDGADAKIQDGMLGFPGSCMG